MTEDEGGVFYEVRLPSGVRVSGLAPNAESAQQVIKAAESGGAYPCDHCAGVVIWDAELRVWVHKYLDPGADPRQCYPPKPEPTAFPAPPSSRDRPFKRGLWPVGNNNCGPDE